MPSRRSKFPRARWLEPKDQQRQDQQEQQPMAQPKDQDKRKPDAEEEEKDETVGKVSDPQGENAEKKRDEV